MPANIKAEQPPFEVRNAIDDLGLTKGQTRILFHIWRRGLCFERVKMIAFNCRMNHVYVRLVIRQLVLRGLITRTIKPGLTNDLQLTAVATWKFQTLEQRKAAQRVAESSETLSLEVQEEFLSRLKVTLNNVETATFRSCLEKDPDRFERVMADVVERVKRGRRHGADALPSQKHLRVVYGHLAAVRLIRACYVNNKVMLRS